MGGHRSKLLVLPQLLPPGCLAPDGLPECGAAEEFDEPQQSPAYPTCSSIRGRRYTGLGRAVKLSSTVVLPPSTAGSAHICGPREAEGEVTNPSIAIKHTSLPQRKKFLYSIFLSGIILDTIFEQIVPLHMIIWSLGKLLASPFFVWLPPSYTSLKV